MKNKFKKGLTLLVITMLLTSMGSVSVLAQDNCDLTESIIPDVDLSVNDFLDVSVEGDYEYIDIDGGVSISKYNGIGGNVTIPATLGGKTVLSINDVAFYKCFDLTSILLPDSLTSIGKWAFADCTSLTNIVLPSNLTSIDKWAFRDCTNLTSINAIPESVIDIGEYAFSECTNLANLTVDVNNSNYTSINGILFNKDVTSLIQCPGGSTATTLPDSLISIEQWAFRGCTTITDITIPEGVTSIDNGAFIGCSNLTHVILPTSLSSLNTAAFIDCTSLTDINLPDNLRMIQSNTFSNCTSLTNITLPDQLTDIGTFAFSSCTSLADITIPENVICIDENAFSNCINLATIQFNSAFTTILSSQATYVGSIPSTTTIIGYDPSTAKDYAINYGNTFQLLEEEPALLWIDITTPATKQVYRIGEPLDISGLVIAGTYSDGTSKEETITAENVQGFESTTATNNQLLTVSINGKTTSYTIMIKSLSFYNYQTHIENIGWQDFSTNGELSGTEGRSLRLEGIKINVDQDNLGVEYSTHIQDIGWQEVKTTGELSGTTHQSLRLEAIKINLTGSDSNEYDICYRVHVQNIGWMDWSKNGEIAGTEGQSLQLEGIEIKIMKINSDLTAYNGVLAAVNQADYTSVSWADYQTIVDTNEITVDNFQTEVDAATTAIITAQNNLISSPTYIINHAQIDSASFDVQTVGDNIITNANALISKAGFDATKYVITFTRVDNGTAQIDATTGLISTIGDGTAIVTFTLTPIDGSAAATTTNVVLVLSEDTI